MNRVRGKNLKWLSLIFLLAFSLTTLNVASTGSTVVFVDPPEIRDDTLQAGSNFAVSIDVSDVSDLYGWEVNMTWDASIVNATTITEGDFLKGPFPWDSHPYKDATEPYWEQTKTPGSSTTITPGWTGEGKPPPLTLVEAVNKTDKQYASSSTPDAEEEWGDFGFITGNMSCVAKLEVGVRAYTTESNITEQDKIEIEVSNDGGSSWSPTPHTVDVYESEIAWWVDVTDDFSWVPSMLTDENFKVRMRYNQIEENATKIKVNYLPVKVIDTLVVEDSDLAYDKVTDTYASFRYSETRGNFTVYDFSHDFPSGCTYPWEETSTIVQVDFNMKYWANASSSGDRYKIVYYVDPSSTETILENWKSTETPLGNYTWPNQTEPNNDVWDWTDVSNIRIVVETDRVGGDSYAVFEEYEASVTVTYMRPTTMFERLETGWAVFSVTTQGSYPGIDGNGSLASVEFEVLAYGDTVLNITSAVLFDSSTPPNPITFTSENGYFNNMIPGDTDSDGDVDYDDFIVLAGAYGSSSGQPAYDERADFDHDGDVDYDDFIVLAGNYGRHI